jgi:cytochrome b561
MLPLWWHCDLKLASSIDLLLQKAAILLVASGFLGVTVTDFTRWRLLSPKFSPQLSASLIAGFFVIHRGLALFTFALITIHVLVVLYFAGV